MPIYMDVHIVPGVKAKNVAEAHYKDLVHQEEYGCKCMTYWIDETRESIFCLIDAPGKEAVEELHSRAHGLIPNKIIEVNSGLVESFLGRIFDPSDAVTTDDGLKIFSDPSFRVLLITQMADPVLLQYQLGTQKALELVNLHSNTIRRNLAGYGGREVEHGGSGFIISFTSATKAVAYALLLRDETSPEVANTTCFKISICGGEPVQTSEQLFGDTIRLARYMCAIARNGQVSIASSVKEIIAKDYLHNGLNNFMAFPAQDETLLISLFDILEKNWQNPGFDITQYCHLMAMSKSQLYRKTIGMTGLAPNALMKEFRLEKAKGLMKQQRYSISQITFESGFTSPSYFTKCFKRKYGLLPMTYIDLLH